MRTRKDIRAHMLASQEMMRMRGGQVGPTDPLGRPNLAGLPSRSISRRYFEEESPPSLLITFHKCIWWEPTSTNINRPPSHPS